MLFWRGYFRWESGNADGSMLYWWQGFVIEWLKIHNAGKGEFL